MKPFNWAGVVAGIIVAEAIAFLWYGPLFGDRWTSLMGRDINGPGAMSAENTDMAFGVMATALWVGGLGWLTSRLGAVGYGGGAKIGLGAWLMFAVPMQSFLFTYAGQDSALAPIELGYTLVAFTIVGALVSGLAPKAGAEATTA
jgi:Protein of unknown function (DUF1761)